MNDTIAPQSEAAGASTGEAAPVAKANGEGAEAPTAEEGTEGAVAEVNDVSYPSLQAAINAAPRKATVKLLADTKENVTISTPYVTLDLNGHTLNGGTEKGKPALTVTARVTIMREDTAENSGVSSHYVIDIQGSGWLTFESGNVTNNSGTESGKGASLVRVGDDSIAKYPGLNIKGGNFTQNNFVVIKVDSGDLTLNGGTLNSTDSYAIENWHRATVKGGTVNGAVAAWTYSGGHNSDLAISGGTINGDVKSVTYDGAEGKTAKVSPQRRRSRSRALRSAPIRPAIWLKAPLSPRTVMALSAWQKLTLLRLAKPATTLWTRHSKRRPQVAKLSPCCATTPRAARSTPEALLVWLT